MLIIYYCLILLHNGSAVVFCRVVWIYPSHKSFLNPLFLQATSVCCADVSASFIAKKRVGAHPARSAPEAKEVGELIAINYYVLHRWIHVNFAFISSTKCHIVLPLFVAGKSVLPNRKRRPTDGSLCQNLQRAFGMCSAIRLERLGARLQGIQSEGTGMCCTGRPR